MGNEKVDDTVNNNDPKENEDMLPDEWMIRPCDTYEEEYTDCRSLKSRFQQYFVFGKYSDCTQWKRDLDNCNRWVEKKDVKSGKDLIESEKRRRMERLKAHYNNDVWKKRSSPPDGWDKPLPEHMQKEYENTYLHIKNREDKGEIEPIIGSNFSVCSIM